MMKKYTIFFLIIILLIGTVLAHSNYTNKPLTPALTSKNRVLNNPSSYSSISVLSTNSNTKQTPNSEQKISTTSSISTSKTSASNNSFEQNTSNQTNSNLTTPNQQTTSSTSTTSNSQTDNSLTSETTSEYDLLYQEYQDLYDSCTNISDPQIVYVNNCMTNNAISNNTTNQSIPLIKTTNTNMTSNLKLKSQNKSVNAELMQNLSTSFLTEKPTTNSFLSQNLFNSDIILIILIAIIIITIQIKIMIIKNNILKKLNNSKKLQKK